MTYRSDLDAARSKRESLTRELAEVEAQLSETSAIEARRRELLEELAKTERDLARSRSKVQLPLLSRVRVASPCSESWAGMRGDDHARHCARCDKTVYDLSSLDAVQAEALLAEHGESMCIRFYRRADGTVMTADCPVGARRARNTRVVAVAAAALSTAALAGVAASSGVQAVPPCGLEATQGAYMPFEEAESTAGEPSLDFVPPQVPASPEVDPEPELIQGRMMPASPEVDRELEELQGLRMR